MVNNIKLLKSVRKLNSLKVKIVVILLLIVLIWLINDNLTSSIIMTFVAIFWVGITIIETIKYLKLVKLLKKLVKIEEEQTRHRMNNMYTYSENMINDLLNEMLNEHFNQSRQRYRVQHINKDKLNNAYKLFRLTEKDSIQTIKKTYRKLAIKWHPDKWISSTEKNKSTAIRNFKKLQSAYDLIKKDKNII